jgi:hypothetical protein
MPEPVRGRSGPSASEAARTLDELDAIGARTRRFARAGFSAVPLTLWGVAWMAGYAALALLPWGVAVPAGLVLALIATVGTWRVRSRDIVSDRARPLGVGWGVVMACSPLLVVTITPAPAATILLFLGALWGVALALLAVASSDRALGVVAAVVVVSAASARLFAGPHAVLVFGLVGGAAMVVLGLVRMRAVR